MSMAKRQQDLLVKGEKERREAFLAWAKTDEGQEARAWVEEQEKKDMAEQLKVTADGEYVVLVAEGEAGKCEVRLSLEEVIRFKDAFDRAQWKAIQARETRIWKEVVKVHGVEDDDEDPGQGVAE